jgi:hypothetical protein
VAQLMSKDGENFIIKPFVVMEQLNCEFDLSSIY